MSTVGERLRVLRRRKGWTLEKLSATSNLSISFLSQIERGVSSASLASLNRVCECLGSSLAQLLRDPSEDPALGAHGSVDNAITHHDAVVAPVRISRSPIAYRFLSNDFPGRKLEIILGELSPGSSLPPAPHRGEEFGYVLEGVLRLTVGNKIYTLEAGDSYHFEATTPHGYDTAGDSSVRILWAQTLTYSRPRPGLPPEAVTDA